MDQTRIRPTGERPAEQHTTEESLPLSQFEMTFAIGSSERVWLSEKRRCRR